MGREMRPITAEWRVDIFRRDKEDNPLAAAENHMAGMLFASPSPGPGFVGHSSIFQFVNADGVDPATTCAQAAIATVLANRHRIPKSIDGLRQIEKAYPADVLSGAWGTSAGRVARALTAYHLGHRHADGREGLEQALSGKRAAISLIQNTAGLGGIGDGAHWFVVFGCDTNGVYVTNYGLPPFIAWSKFEDMWSAPIPTMDGMGKRVICC
jgi:hypothetical protein